MFFTEETQKVISSQPWCCCHFKAWPIKAINLEGGTTVTSFARAAKDKHSILAQAPLVETPFQSHEIPLRLENFLCVKKIYLEIAEKFPQETQQE